ncbi:inhibin beta, inhb, putative [Pediculus humanus corporis]|uniref:Inhibin beta, inhb, putative n=1 Tax=Pediculus humanus subsp. corporis TaxID=121224 RepID=E0VGU7_PEDHC|nr:inhibin beta, inhb, putative [Pediculus humanus corporis]EEB12603.1 inhibin beta, inhb, putative [Pediculus humanus corporis]
MIFNLEKETPRMPWLPYDNYHLGESICPTCYFERNSDEIRLEAIKLQILSKLGLKEKPTITLPVPRDILIETLSRAGDYPMNGNFFGEQEYDETINNKKEKEPEIDEGLLESEPDDFYGRTSEIITFAEPGKN